MASEYIFSDTKILKVLKQCALGGVGNTIEINMKFVHGHKISESNFGGV